MLHILVWCNSTHFYVPFFYMIIFNSNNYQILVANKSHLRYMMARAVSCGPTLYSRLSMSLSHIPLILSLWWQKHPHTWEDMLLWADGSSKEMSSQTMQLHLELCQDIAYIMHHTFHWPKQATWSSPKLIGEEDYFQGTREEEWVTRRVFMINNSVFYRKKESMILFPLCQLATLSF